MRGSSGIDVSTRDVSLSLVCALGGRSVGRLFGRCRGVVAAADGELCRQVHKPCAWSSCPTCQYVTCTRHACASGSAVRCAVLGWRSAGGRLSGGAMLLGVARMMHRSHVATGRRRGGASEQQVGRVVVDGDAVRAYPVYAVSLYVYRRARPHCAFALSRRAIAHSRHSRDSAFTYRGRFPVARRSSRRGVVYMIYAATSNRQASCNDIYDLDQSGTRRTRQRIRINVNQLPRSPLRPGAPARATRSETSLVPRRPNFQCDTGLLLTAG